jgi:hypothetical protein
MQTQTQPNTSNNKYYEILNQNNINKITFFREDDKTALWVDSKDLLCNCPRIKTNKKYIIMAKSTTLIKQSQLQQSQSQQEASYELNNSENYFNNNQTISTLRVVSQIDSEQLNGILLDRETFIAEWRPELLKRLRRFVKHYQNGKC